LDRHVDLIKVNIFFIILSLAFSHSCSGIKHSDISKLPSGFYAFNKQEIQSIINKNGISDLTVFKGGITRNAKGTELRIFDRTSEFFVVINCDGIFSKHKMPYKAVWLDDESNIVAYLDNGYVKYSNGYTEKTFFNERHGIDQSGRYFWKREEKGIAGIYATKKPNIKLVEVPYVLCWIYISNDRLYLFGVNEPFKIHYKIYNLNNDELNLQKESFVQLPDKKSSRLTVVDFNPDAQYIVFAEQFDLKKTNKWYGFNLDDGTYESFGDAEDYGFFLKCNIISKIN